MATGNRGKSWGILGAIVMSSVALDAEMAKKLREANPEAFRNIVSRMLEANGRGFWQPDAEKLEKLRELYELTDEELEGVTV